MRAKEFIVETQRGKQLDAQQRVSPGSAFTVNTGTSLDTALFRAMQIMGRLPENADDIDALSYVTNRPMIVTYTDWERDMVIQSFKKMGLQYREHAPEGSEEPPAVNNTSPVKGFKGYPR